MTDWNATQVKVFKYLAFIVFKYDVQSTTKCAQVMKVKEQLNVFINQRQSKLFYSLSSVLKPGETSS